MRTVYCFVRAVEVVNVGGRAERFGEDADRLAERERGSVDFC